MAYEAKDGTFSISMLDKKTKEIKREYGFPNKSTAVYEAKMFAWKKHGECRYAPMKHGNDYLANVWKD